MYLCHFKWETFSGFFLGLDDYPGGVVPNIKSFIGDV